jgi:hypothetical protein
MALVDGSPTSWSSSGAEGEPLEMARRPAGAPRFGCPNCKSEDISENNILPVYLRVSAWCSDGEPASYSYPWREKGGLVTDDANPRYHCNHCEEDFEEVIDLEQNSTGAS